MSSPRSIMSIGFLVYIRAVAALVTQATNSTVEESTLYINAAAVYNLVDTFNSNNFFDQFSFFDGSDPTHGFVSYQNAQSAFSNNLAYITNNEIYMGVDFWTANPPSPGRDSVRLTSNKAYHHGLFIADIAHMPGSICGVWPAFWLFGPNWPNNGEIDIIEGVNLAGTDQITLHTAPGCSINIAGSQQGTNLLNSDCNTDNAFTGCGAITNALYGNNFNNVGGGVYAMQWESSGVYVWFWPRGSVPNDITSGAPVTGNWGLPIVAFNGGSSCNIDSFFGSQNIVFDTTFCGDWAGAVWGNGCSNLANSCNDYVSNNPGAFSNAYWLVNSVTVYQQ